MKRFRHKQQKIVAQVPYQNCPAKTFESPRGPQCGRTVENHCRIVGEVAREIIRRSPVAAIFPEGAEFAAASHDIGKVSPTFYNKIKRACAEELVPGFNPDLERGWGGHAGVSQLTALYLEAPEYVPEILGQHHGFSPNLVRECGQKMRNLVVIPGWKNARSWCRHSSSLLEPRGLILSPWPRLDWWRG